MTGQGESNVRDAEFGVARDPGGSSRAWHIWTTDYEYEGPSPKVTGIKTLCGGVKCALPPEGVPGYVQVDEAQEYLPALDSEKYCHGCVMNFERKRKRAGTWRQKKEDLVDDSIAIVRAALHDGEALVKQGDPPLWRVVFLDRGKTRREYVAEGKEILDHERFRLWWLQHFLRALTLTGGAWTLLLDDIAKKAETKSDHDREEITKRDVIREIVLRHLAKYRIVENRESMGVGYGYTVFQKDGKVWVVYAEIVSELQKHGFDIGATVIKDILGDVVIGQSDVIKINKVPTRCWPIDPKKTAIPEEVLVLEENEMLVQPDPKAAQKTLGGDEL